MGKLDSSYYSARMCCLRCHTEFLFKNRRDHAKACRPGHIALGVRKRQPLERYRSRVRELWAKGASVERIARTVHIRDDRVRAVLATLPADERDRKMLGTRQAARALGLDRNLLVRLVKARAVRGLRVTPPGGGRRRNARSCYWKFTFVDLAAFVRDRRYWPLYGASAMGNTVLRQLATTLRQNAGGRWLNIAEIADLARVSVNTARQRAQGGWLGGLKQTNWGVLRWWWLPAGAELPVVPEHYFPAIRHARQQRREYA